MIDIFLAVASPSILVVLLLLSRREKAYQQEGWGFIFAGFCFVVCGVLIGITDSFFGLGNSIVIREDEYQNFMATMIGFLPGFILLGIGFWKWVPAVLACQSPQIPQVIIKEIILEEPHPEIEKYETELRDMEKRLEQERIEHNLAEGTLEECEGRYRSLLNRANDGICLISNGTIEYANPQMLNLTGYIPEEMLGTPIAHYVHPDNILKFNSCLDQGSSELALEQNFKIILSHHDGIKVEAEVSVSNLGHNGDQARLVIFHDITGYRQAAEKSASQNDEIHRLSRDLRKRDEELESSRTNLMGANHKINEKEAELRVTFENSNDAIFHLELEGKVININSQAESIFGYKRIEMIGKDFTDINIFTLEDLLKITGAFNQVIEGAVSPLLEFEARDRNGDSVYLETRPRLIETEGGPKSILVILRDNSEQKRSEKGFRKDLKKLGNRIEERTEALARASKELQSETGNRRRAESKWHESEARWNSLVATISDIIITVRSNGIIESMNRTIQGTNFEQAIGKDIYEYVHPEYQPNLKKAMEQVFLNGSSEWCEIVGIGPGGTYAWYETRMGPVKYNGDVIAATLAATDITERKWAQKTLQESEQRFREMADLLPQTVFEIDMSGNFIFTNNAGLQHTGYIQEDIDKGLNVLQLFTPPDRKRVMKDIEKVLKGEEFGGHEYTGLRKDGSTFQMLAHSSPIIRDEMIVGMRGMILDITERKQAEEKVTQRNRELATLNTIAETVNQMLDLDEILNQSLDTVLAMLEIEHGGIYLLNKETDILELRINRGINNELMELITPVAVGNGIPGIVAQSGEPLLIESIYDSIELIGKKIQDAVAATHGKSVMCLPLQARGKVLGVMFAMTCNGQVLDTEEQQLLITVSHAISTAIENIQLLEAQSHALASAQADQLRAAFLSSISHEVRTPLTEIKGFASTLIQPDIEWDAETQRDFLMGINQASDRLLDVINDVLDMSKIQAGVLTLEKRPVKFKKLIERLQTKFDNPTWKQNLSVLLPDNLPSVLADEKRLGQVVVSLVESAAHEGRIVTVEAAISDDWLIISVIDSEKELFFDRLEKVFEPFHGLEENTECRRSGSGLKLAISKGIIEVHGGKMWAENATDCGSIYRFTLPLVEKVEKVGQENGLIEELT